MPCLHTLAVDEVPIDADAISTTQCIAKHPDIVIGIDYFFDFCSNIEKLRNRLFLIQIQVGPLLARSVPRSIQTLSRFLFLISFLAGSAFRSCLGCPLLLYDDTNDAIRHSCRR